MKPIDDSNRPRPAFEPGEPARLSWRKIAGIAAEHKRTLALAQAAALLATAASVPIPLLFPLLVDEVLLDQPGPAVGLMQRVFPPAWHGPVHYIVAVLAVTLVLRFLVLGMTVVQTRQFSVIAGDITLRIRESLLRHLQRTSMAEYELLGSGSTASHLTTDLGTVESFVRSTISRFLVNVLTLAGIAAVLLWMHWKLALFILLFNPAVIYLTVALGRRVKELKEKENSAVAAFQGALVETLDAMHQIRAANRDSHFLGRLTTAARTLRDHAVRYEWKSSAAARISFLAFLFGFDMFRAVAMLAVVLAGLTVGEMFAVFSYLWFMMGPVQELLNVQYSYFGATGAMHRVNRLFALAEEPRHPTLEDPFAGRTTVGIRVESLRFDYRARSVLHDIDLEIEPGEKVGLVGASGGGKSTFVRALLGLYPATSGRILYGGVPVERIGWEVVRENVATVLQHPVLFHDSIRFNLTLGRTRDEADLWRALEIAQIAADVRELDGGLDAAIGRQGSRLSGGQRQRIAIARLVLAGPKVVILDEATSALDLETEAALYRALMAELEGRTVLLIAHRLSTLRHVDRVLVFEDGTVAEQGSHERLVARGGLYSELYGRLGPDGVEPLRTAGRRGDRTPRPLPVAKG